MSTHGRTPMPWMKKMAAIAATAEAARRYAKRNPEQAARYLDQAAAFVDKQTKGRYTAKIDGVTHRVKGVAGVNPTPGSGGAPGRTGANGQYTAGAAGYSGPQ